MTGTDTRVPSFSSSGVESVIDAAGGFKAAETNGQADTSEQALVASLYAIAALALTAAAARQRHRWRRGAKGGSGGGCIDNTKGDISGG